MGGCTPVFAPISPAANAHTHIHAHHWVCVEYANRAGVAVFSLSRDGRRRTIRRAARSRDGPHTAAPRDVPVSGGLALPHHLACATDQATRNQAFVAAVVGEESSDLQKMLQITQDLDTVC